MDGIDSIGSVCPRDSVPIFGTGSSSRRPPRGPSPLPLRGRVWGHVELMPYPKGAESLRARDKRFDTPGSPALALAPEL